MASVKTMLAAIAMIEGASASPGQGCLLSGVCDATAASCSPAACVTGGGAWIPASSATGTVCADNLSCNETVGMATGVSVGLAIAAQAGAISAATGADFAAKMTQRQVAYEDATGGTSFKAKVQALGATACGSSGCGTALDTYITQVLAGTTVTGDSAGWSAYEDGRDEAFKKAIFNQAMSYMTIHYANSGLSTAADWNTAWAIYGYLGAPDAGSTPYATANKRCKNYDTCHVTLMAGSSGEAKTNVAVEAAFGTASSANYDIIRDNILTTYIQASLRYANKVDKDVTKCPPGEYREHQGEGHSFGGRLIQNLPGVTLSSDINTAIADVFMTSPCNTSAATGSAIPCEGASGRYCMLLPLLTAIVPAGTELGALNSGESPRTCPDPLLLDVENCPVAEEEVPEVKLAASSSMTTVGVAALVTALMIAFGI